MRLSFPLILSFSEPVSFYFYFMPFLAALNGLTEDINVPVWDIRFDRCSAVDSAGIHRDSFRAVFSGMRGLQVPNTLHTGVFKTTTFFFTPLPNEFLPIPRVTLYSRLVL